MRQRFWPRIPLHSFKRINNVILVFLDCLLLVLIPIPICFKIVIRLSFRSAEDWNLATPLATCSLIVLRRDSALLIRFLSEKQKEGGPSGAMEKYLFAQCSVELDFTQGDESESTTKRKLRPNKMEHWVESVVDSSRYFVVRISDANTGREANIGMGFRERNDALNFKMSLQEYGNAMRKEGIVSCLDNGENNKAEDSNTPSQEGDISSAVPITEVSKLSLKEGEKIHVNLKGTSRTRARKTQSGDTSTSGKPLLLRKPPPTTSLGSSAIVVNTDASGKSPSTSDDNNVTDALSSVAAVAENNDVEEDEWGDFEGA